MMILTYGDMRFRVKFNDPFLTKIAVKSIIAKTQSIYNFIEDVLDVEAGSRYSLLNQAIPVKQVLLDVVEIEELISKEFESIETRFENGIYKINATNDIGTRYLNIEFGSVTICRKHFDSTYIYILVNYENIDYGYEDLNLTSYEFGIQIDSETRFPIGYMDRLTANLIKFIIVETLKRIDVTRKKLKKIIVKTLKRMYKQYIRESYGEIYGDYELVREEFVLRKVKHVI